MLLFLSSRRRSLSRCFMWIDERFTPKHCSKNAVWNYGRLQGMAGQEEGNSLENVTNLLFQNSPIEQLQAFSFHISELPNSFCQSKTKLKLYTTVVSFYSNEKRLQQKDQPKNYLQKLQWYFQQEVKKSDDVWLLIQKDEKERSAIKKTIVFRSFFQFGTHATHFFFSWKNRRRNLRFQSSEGERSSHVRLRAKRGLYWQKLSQGRVAATRVPLVANRGLGIWNPLPLVLQCQCLLVDLPSRGSYLPETTKKVVQHFLLFQKSLLVIL